MKPTHFSQMLRAAAVLLVASGTASADQIPLTWTVNDVSETISAAFNIADPTTLGYVSILTDTCDVPNENCHLVYSRLGMTITSVTLGTGVGPFPIAPNTYYYTPVFEGPPNNAISDAIRANWGIPGNVFDIAFYSEIEHGAQLDCLLNVGGCTGVPLPGIMETGATELMATVTWNGGEVTDTFYFTSDPPDAGPPVPEPASLFLLGTGLLAGARRWRTRRG